MVVTTAFSFHGFSTTTVVSSLVLASSVASRSDGYLLLSLTL